jgi:uncharacterized Fe-S radical SAM superfamily protein PflX
LDGIVDIYLPDMKYMDAEQAAKYSGGASDYPEVARDITVQEYLEAMDWAQQYGLTNLDPKSVAVRNFYDQRRSG